MPNTSEDPVDHARTTRQHAGETMKDGRNAPGLVGVVLGVVALVAGLFAFAVGALIGFLWALTRHRQVREQEQRWHDKHPSAPEVPPTS